MTVIYVMLALALAPFAVLGALALGVAAYIGFAFCQAYLRY